MYINKKLSLFIFFILSTSMAWSQRDIPKTLYLKDGSFLQGSLVGKTPTEYFWQLSDGSQVKFSKDLVKTIKEQKENFQYLKNGKIKKRKGFYGRIMAGGLFEKKINQWSNQDHAPSINLTVGYQINSKISLGIGSGYDGYNEGPPIIPLYLDLVGDILNSAVTPYYKLSAGYGFSSPRDFQKMNSNVSYKGGVLVHPSVGVKFYTRHNLAWFLDFGYRFQRYDRQFVWGGNPERWTLQRTTFRVGMEF